jgi:hypothetical protein
MLFAYVGFKVNPKRKSVEQKGTPAGAGGLAPPFYVP